MKEALIDPELGGFAKTDITVLKNPKKQEMEEHIYDLFSKNNRKKDDLLLFYFSGHGITDEKGIFYFSTSETRKENGRLRPTTALSSNHVHTWINECPSRGMAIILDCCHSGAFAKGMSAKGAANAQIKEQLGGEGRAILTAASATEYAWAKDEFDLSAYTHYLLEGVRTGNANLDSNDWLSMEELHEYVRQKISDAKLEMTPEFYPVKEGAKIRLSKAKITDPQEKYRKELQRYLKRGQIPNYVRDRLENLREKLQISQGEAQLIEQKVFAPLQQKQENLKKYEKALRQALAEEGSLDSNAVEELKRYQQQLELQDEDIAQIEAQILPQQKEKILLTIIEPKPQQEDAETFYKRGIEQLQKHAYSDAIAAFNRALQIQPDYAEVHYERAIARLNLGDIQGAIEDSQEAAKLFFDGDDLAGYKKALARINEINQSAVSPLPPPKPQTHNLEECYQQGLDYNNQESYQEAIASFEGALKLAPNHAGAYCYRGFAYFCLGNYQQASEDCDRALKIDSNYADAYICRGLTRFGMGNNLQATQDINKVIQLDSKHGGAYLVRSLMRASFRDHQGALADFNWLRRLAPDYNSAEHNRILAFAVRGNKSEVILYLQKTTRQFFKGFDAS
jgi:tetratricopeptide (TPR) repeat protein